MIASAVRFLASGAVNTGLTLVLYWLLLALMPAQAAYATSFAVGVAFSYALNLNFVFRGRHSTRKISLFPLIYLTTYVLGAGILHVAIYELGVPRGAAPLLSIACTLPFNFLLTRWLLDDHAAAIHDAKQSD